MYKLYLYSNNVTINWRYDYVTHKIIIIIINEIIETYIIRTTYVFIIFSCNPIFHNIHGYDFWRFSHRYMIVLSL